jgi:hypothetical protein
LTWKDWVHLGNDALLVLIYVLTYFVWSMQAWWPSCAHIRLLLKAFCNYRSSPNLWAPFSTVKLMYILLFTKIGFGYISGDLFTNTSGYPFYRHARSLKRAIFIQRPGLTMQPIYKFVNYIESVPQPCKIFAGRQVASLGTSIKVHFFVRSFTLTSARAKELKLPSRVFSLTN